MARTKGNTVDKFVKPLKERISNLESQLETERTQKEALIQDRRDLKAVVGLEKSKRLDIKIHYDAKNLELKKREKELDLEVSNKLKPLQGKYSQLQIDYRQRENQLSSFERRITDLESELELTMKGKMDESPEALTILHKLYDQNEIYNELSTNFNSNLEDIVKEKKLRTNDAKYTIDEIKHGRITVNNDFSHCDHHHECASLISNRKHIELYSKAIKDNLSIFKNWDNFNEYINLLRIDFKDGVNYIDWAVKGMEADAKFVKIDVEKSLSEGAIVDDEDTSDNYIIINQLSTVDDLLRVLPDDSNPQIFSDSPISKERHQEIFRYSDGTRYSCAADWLSRAEVNLIINDKLDEKSYNQLSKDYQDMVNSGTIFLSDMDNITIARDKMLGLSE